MVQMQYEVDGIMQTSRNLNLMIDNLDNLWDFYEESIDLIEERTDELFKSKWKAVQKGEKWAALKDSTEKARAMRRGYYRKQPTSNPGPMRRTWNLQESRTRTIWSVEASLTLDAYYAVYHHRGDGNLPERSLIDLDNDTNAELVRILQKFIWENIWIYGRQV